MAIAEAAKTAAHFFYKNLTVRDPRSTQRHNWKWLFFVAMDITVARKPVRRPQTGTAVVLVNRLGDALISLPLIQALHEESRKKGEPFLVIGDESWKVLKDNVYKDIPTSFIDERRFRLDTVYRLKTSRWLRSQNFETAMCFMHHRLEMRDDALVHVSGAKNKIVSALPYYKYRWYPWLFDHYLKQMSKIAPVLGLNGSSDDRADIASSFERKVPHAFDRLEHFYKEVQGSGKLSPQPLPPFATNENFSPDTVILNPGASNKERVWPLTEWVALAYQIADTGRPVCITGGPAEEGLIPELRSLIEAGKKTHGESAFSRISEAINQLPFESLIGLYQKAVCFIGPDTGGSHLAYWAGTPTITILHKDPAMEAFHRLGDFFPYPANVLKTPYRCVWATLDEFHLRNGSQGVREKVWTAFNELISERSIGHSAPTLPKQTDLPIKSANNAKI